MVRQPPHPWQPPSPAAGAQRQQQQQQSKRRQFFDPLAGRKRPASQAGAASSPPPPAATSAAQSPAELTRPKSAAVGSRRLFQDAADSDEAGPASIAAAAPRASRPQPAAGSPAEADAELAGLAAALGGLDVEALPDARVVPRLGARRKAAAPATAPKPRGPMAKFLDEILAEAGEWQGWGGEAAP